MEIIVNKYFTKLLADAGKVICSTDGIWDATTGIKEVDLGIDDLPENYFEADEIEFFPDEEPPLEEEDNGYTED